MFLKRSLAVAAGVALFIVFFIIYLNYCDATMEGRFRAEREKYHSDNLVLVPPTSVATTAAPQTASASSTPSNVPPPAPLTDSSAQTNAPSTDSSTPSIPSTDTSTPDTSMPASTPSSDTSMPSSAPSSDTSMPASTPDNSTPATNAPSQDPNAPMQPTTPSTRNDLPAAPFVVGSFHFPSLISAALLGQTATNASPAATNTAPNEVVTIPTTPSNAPAATEPAVVPVPAVAPTTNAPAPAPAATNTVAVPETNVTPQAPPEMSAITPSAEAKEGSVIVLLYHQFVPAGVHIAPKMQWTLNVDVFESEMAYIHDNGFHVVSVQDMIRFLKHEITLPPNSVCITIDDGYKSAYAYAAPVLKKYGYPWTFFIYPQFVTNAEGPPTTGAVSWNDLLALQKDGVDIECHSMTHPKLSSHRQAFKGPFRTLSPDEYAAFLVNETVNSKAILEQHMGKKINCFAYPFGDYNSQVKAAAIAAGYEAIFTVAGNPVHSTSDLKSIGRYTITLNETKDFVAWLHEGALGLADATPAPGEIITNPRPVITAVVGYGSPLDPSSIETTVYGFDVKHDFDPNTNALRLYLPRDLIQPKVPVSIRVKNHSGQTMVAQWTFDYQPAGQTTHAPISGGAATPAPSAPASTNAAQKVSAPATNAPAMAPVARPAVPAVPATTATTTH